MNIDNLTGIALDWAVAKCEGILEDGQYPDEFWDNKGGCCNGSLWSEAWCLGGPIIEREGIDLYCNVPTNESHPNPTWRGSWQGHGHRYGFGTEIRYGPTPLIAAMRCYVASKLGNEIDIPKELL